jgi:hypothetical protein
VSAVACRPASSLLSGTPLSRCGGERAGEILWFAVKCRGTPRRLDVHPRRLVPRPVPVQRPAHLRQLARHRAQRPRRRQPLRPLPLVLPLEWVVGVAAARVRLRAQVQQSAELRVPRFVSARRPARSPLSLTRVSSPRYATNASGWANCLLARQTATAVAVTGPIPGTPSSASITGRAARAAASRSSRSASRPSSASIAVASGSAA